MSDDGLRKRATAPPPEAAPTPAAPTTGGAKVRKRSIMRRACSGFCVFLQLAVAVVLLLYVCIAARSTLVDGMSLAQSARQPYVAFNFAMMRFFRDLARVKARRRRFGQENALMTVLLSHDKPLPLADVDGEGRVALTVEELAEYDGRPLPGSEERAPLYLSILGYGRVAGTHSPRSCPPAAHTSRPPEDGSHRDRMAQAHLRRERRKGLLRPRQNVPPIDRQGCQPRVLHRCAVRPVALPAPRAQLHMPQPGACARPLRRAPAAGALDSPTSCASPTGCLEPGCLISSLKDLTVVQRREADKVRRRL